MQEAATKIMAPPCWRITLPGGRWTFVWAKTKSEARGQAKIDFGLDKLPEGTTIVETGL